MHGGKAFRQKRRLWHAGASLEREVLEEMSESIAACIKQCQQAQREGVAAADIITSDQSALASFSKAKLGERWQTVIEASLSCGHQGRHSIQSISIK